MIRLISINASCLPAHANGPTIISEQTSYAERAGKGYLPRPKGAKADGFLTRSGLSIQRCGMNSLGLTNERSSRLYYYFM